MNERSSIGFCFCILDFYIFVLLDVLLLPGSKTDNKVRILYLRYLLYIHR